MRKLSIGQLQRRNFLKASIAAGFSAGLPRVAFLSASCESDDGTIAIRRAKMIWSTKTVPVPLLGNGSADAIASSTPDHPAGSTTDLHSVFRKQFTLKSVPKTATVDLFAYTRYRLYVNGTYAGRGPSRYQNQRPEYDTREITALLQTGANTLTVLGHRDAPTGRIMRHNPGFAAVLSLMDGEGAARVISTDESWVAIPDLSFGPRNEAWGSIEEHIDARKGIDLSGPDPGSELTRDAWPAAIAVGGPDFFPVWPRTTPLQSETERTVIVADSRALPVSLNPGETVEFAIPEIAQAYHDLGFTAEAGSQMQVEFVLPQGAVSGSSTYIARAGRQRWMGGDTFALKQVRVRLVSGKLTMHSAQIAEVRYPFELVGSFKSSDPFLDRLWIICARSLQVLSEDAYVDCADRERVEWTDNSPPAFDVTSATMRGPNDVRGEHWADSRLLAALLRRISLTQQPDGQLKAHSCSERFDIHAIMEDRSCDWVVLLRQYYESTGDRGLVQELWPVLQRLLQWFLERRTARGLVLARDWEVWDNPLRYQVCEAAGLNAMTYKALVDAAYLAKETGQGADAVKFAEAGAALRESFNTLLWNAAQGTYDGALFGPGSKTAEQLNHKMFAGPIVDGRYGPTAQGALFALYAGIVPEERMASVRKWVLANTQAITGAMSQSYYFRMLYTMDDPAMDTAVLARMRTGWRLQVESPWQTTWEELIDGGGSKVHIYGAVPGAFLSRQVLGVRRDGPARERRIVFEPRCGDLAEASGKVVTEFGLVDVAWKLEGKGSLRAHCATPERCSLTVRFYARGGSLRFKVNGEGKVSRRVGAFVVLELPAGEYDLQYPAESALA